MLAIINNASIEEYPIEEYDNIVVYTLYVSVGNISSQPDMFNEHYLNAIKSHDRLDMHSP